jgi:hypothetical protein
VITTPQNVSILPKSIGSAGAIKDFANQLRNSKVDFTTPKQRSDLADALVSIQNQIDPLVTALKANLPLPNPLVITDASGTILGAIGNYLDPTSNSVISPAWFTTLVLGGSSASTGTRIILPTPLWQTPSGGISRATFNQASVTLPELAQRVAALIEDLENAGILTT